MRNVPTLGQCSAACRRRYDAARGLIRTRGLDRFVDGRAWIGLPDCSSGSGDEPPTPEILQWVAQRVHPRARVTRFASLPGGITADVDRITLDAPTGVVEVVLRRWPNEDWAAGLVNREASALEAVRGRVPAPELVAMDHDGATTGVRVSLTSALPGDPDLAPADMTSWLGRAPATTQAAIHAIPHHLLTEWDGWFDDGAASSSPERYGVRYRPLDWLADRGLRDAAREAAAGPLVADKVLVHGDYQHFNVLWRHGRLSGVVDWPNAATGIRGSDVGHCRAEARGVVRPHDR